VSFTSRLRSVVLLVVLEFGAMLGLTIPPERIRALMEMINKQTQAHTLPNEANGGDGKGAAKL
jgi:hypothetical protein